uniref:Uncharacterized protein n=1 Tax=Podoviridae sp. cttxo15 TaxID=2826584 RepID=A0A8S5N1V7_9CAUD|nr:MAG TPA: hypothetical protein [Podoviridae sp. cttxo15]
MSIECRETNDIKVFKENSQTFNLFAKSILRREFSFIWSVLNWSRTIIGDEI